MLTKKAAISGILSGPNVVDLSRIRFQMRPMDDDLTTTAYHESGHAVMASFLGGHVDRLTVEPENSDRYGDTRVLWVRSCSEREFAVREIKVSLAGPVVEMIYNGQQYQPEFLAEWKSDWEMAVSSGATFLPSRQLLATYLEKMVYELIRFFERDDVWAAVAALADELEAHETLEADDIHEIIRAWPIH